MAVRISSRGAARVSLSALVGTAVLVGSFAIGGVCLADTSPTSPKPTAIPGPPGPLPPNMASAEAIDALGTKTYPGTYGGVRAVNDGQSFIVYLTTLDPASETAFQAVSTQPITFKKTPQSQASLRALEDKINALMPGLAAKGIRVVNSGTNIDTGRVDVGVKDMKASDPTAIASAMGSSLVTVTESDYDVGTSRPSDLSRGQ